MSQTGLLPGLPIGIDDFKKLRERNCYFVDKSLLIKEIIDDPSEAKLITRPRRFGKTLNLSMLRYFFEKSAVETGSLFHDLQIWAMGDTYRSEQGRYPVIYLTFKDVKYNKLDACLERLKIILADEYKRHDYLLSSERIRESDKRQFTAVMDETASYVRLSAGLDLLTRLLYEHHQTEVLVLIDEYDTPINQGYLCGYYEEIIEFMKSLLGGGLKGNRFLKTAVITGIYRVAKESIFSDFNNLKVSAVAHDLYADKFGFTENEVEEFLLTFGMNSKIQEVKEWYNGYLFGHDTVIYNPWSILNYIDQKQFRPYWSTPPATTSSGRFYTKPVGK